LEVERSQLILHFIDNLNITKIAVFSTKLCIRGLESLCYSYIKTYRQRHKGIIISVICCSSDRNIRPEVTRPWAGYQGTDIPIQSANMSDIFSCIFYHIPLYFKFFIFIFNGNLYHYNLNYFLSTAYEITTSFITVKWRHPKRAIVQHATHLTPPMPDEISGMGKTNENASPTCKKTVAYSFQLRTKTGYPF
jgi:hypothetical protein